MFGDVKSILGGATKKEEKDEVKQMSLLNIGKKSSARRSESSFKRPEKMHRELYNLIGSSDVKEASTVVPTEIRRGFAQLNAQVGSLGGRPVRKYKWVPFTNEARNDSLQLYHWQRVDKLENPEPYPFAKFNKVISIPDFTDEEYEKYFKVEKWTLEETRHLFDVCRRFDIRWPIVHDRYDREKYGLRSMEDLKERFYAIVNEIALLKDPTCEPICFDADHERRRKEQAIKLYNRTKSQVKEEEYLAAELKKIEARKKERERRAHDLQKLINTVDPPASPSVSGACMSPAMGKKKSVFRQKGNSTLASASRLVKIRSIRKLLCYSRILAELACHRRWVDVAVSSIRFPEFKSAGAHLRSQEMKLPTNIGQKKLKNIEVVLNKCKLDLNPMGLDTVVAAYNEFRSLVIALQEMKTMLQSTEFELESARGRLIEEGKQPFDIEPRMRISTLPEGGLDPDDVTGEDGAPASIRRIASYIDTSSSTNPLLVRKRKFGVSSSSMDLVRSRKA
ncbi:unnamed protein product [Haemonchus placei]|uniref:DNA methyltransferase 1-associated protein 1 n=1 Tax=Haemonchus placei TaxID=6290 RepID=A0A0N4W5I7_HAEPC|nr:unnamed protein product [Haemonchus placei]